MIVYAQCSIIATLSAIYFSPSTSHFSIPFPTTNRPFPAFDMSEYDTFEFTRYAAAHENINGEGDARPTALQIVTDNDLEGFYPFPVSGSSH